MSIYKVVEDYSFWGINLGLIITLFTPWVLIPTIGLWFLSTKLLKNIGRY